jgi:hypothetical protein
MQPPAEAGPGHAACGAPTPRVRPHPSWLTWPSPLVGGLVVGPGPLLHWCFGPGNCIGGLSPFILFCTLLKHVFCFTLFGLVLCIFHLFLEMCPSKHIVGIS